MAAPIRSRASSVSDSNQPVIKERAQPVDPAVSGLVGNPVEEEYILAFMNSINPAMIQQTDPHREEVIQTLVAEGYMYESEGGFCVHQDTGHFIDKDALQAMIDRKTSSPAQREAPRPC